MKFYSIKVDSNKYQWIMPQVDDGELLDYTTFDCKPKLEDWKQTEWYRFNPKNSKGNFYSLGTNCAFAFDKKVYDSDLFALLELSGEIIPIHLKNESLFIINVLDCVNALDEDSTKWDIYDDGSRGRILEYSFYTDRITESTLFKIPQTSKSEILTYTGVKDEEDEFMKLYQNLGFKGLLFDNIY